MKQNVYSVSQINRYIKNMISQDYLCSSVMIKGELSNVKYHGSGHIYFTLKDSGAAISCVMFARDRRGLSFVMEEGQQVICLGSIDVYERDGKYQLYAKQIELSGDGQLYEQFEKLKKELQEMGMFEPEYKLAIPKYAKRLGVVTAETGAAIRDIIQVSTRRNPFIQIELYPAIVQGEYAIDSIVKGIKVLEKRGVDVMIVGRGGGSIEDLWAFNSREVAQAVFDCQVPIISAVGHETDTTIIDFVSDLRAPTPSAAAELAVCEIDTLFGQIQMFEDELTLAMEKRLELLRHKTQNFQLRLEAMSPKAKIKERRMRTLSIEDLLVQLMEKKVTQAKHRLQVDAANLNAMSPLHKLESGFSYVADAKGKTLTDVEKVKKGDLLSIYLKNGKVSASVVDIDKESIK